MTSYKPLKVADVSEEHVAYFRDMTSYKPLKVTDVSEEHATYFRDMTSYKPLKVNRRFGGTCGLLPGHDVV
jgi:hypothetical protein